MLRKSLAFLVVCWVVRLKAEPLQEQLSWTESGILCTDESGCSQQTDSGLNVLLQSQILDASNNLLEEPDKSAGDDGLAVVQETERKEPTTQMLEGTEKNGIHSSFGRRLVASVSAQEAEKSEPQHDESKKVILLAKESESWWGSKGSKTSKSWRCKYWCGPHKHGSERHCSLGDMASDCGACSYCPYWEGNITHNDGYVNDKPLSMKFISADKVNIDFTWDRDAEGQMNVHYSQTYSVKQAVADGKKKTWILSNTMLQYSKFNGTSSDDFATMSGTWYNNDDKLVGTFQLKQAFQKSVFR